MVLCTEAEGMFLKGGGWECSRLSSAADDFRKDKDSTKSLLDLWTKKSLVTFVTALCVVMGEVDKLQWTDK